MRTGRLTISRGIGEGEAPPRLRLVPTEAGAEAPAIRRPEPAVARSPQPMPATPDYHLVHDRLVALERLARLLEQGALSPAEFAAEKAVILSLPAEELVLREPLAARPVRAPRSQRSLAGHMLSWKFLPVGLAAGLVLSFLAQPRETLSLIDQAFRYLGV